MRGNRRATVESMKTILITGAGSGIGKDLAFTLAKMGHTVYATTHTKQSADMIQTLAQKERLPITSFVLDVTDPKDYQKAVDLYIDVLVNNAGMGETGSLAEVDIQKVRDNFETNLFGPLELTQAILRQMIKRDQGRIIFVSSIAGRVTMPFLGPYSMTKFALSSGAEALRGEIATLTQNIHVSVVEPGAYATGFNQKMLEKKYRWMDEKSYFYPLISTLKRNEKKSFDFLEQKRTDTIVAKLVEAIEDEHPRFRYSAPWWQALGVQLYRIMGT